MGKSLVSCFLTHSVVIIVFIRFFVAFNYQLLQTLAVGLQLRNLYIPIFTCQAASQCTAYDATYCYNWRCLSVFVCLLILSVNHAKTAELIEISFGMWTCVGPENHGYWGIGITHEKGHFRGSYLGMLIKL